MVPVVLHRRGSNRKWQELDVETGERIDPHPMTISAATTVPQLALLHHLSWHCASTNSRNQASTAPETENRVHDALAAEPQRYQVPRSGQLQAVHWR
eukprot:4643135-Pyramimonas_sp.AAC.2